MHSDNSVYAQLTQLVGPKAVVDTARRLGVASRLDPYFSIGSRRARRQPPRHEPSVRDDRERRPAGRRQPAREPPARDRARSSTIAPASARSTARSAGAGADRGRGGELTSILEDVVSSGTGTPRADPGRRGRRQDRHDRQLRGRLVRRLPPRSSRRSGSGTPTSCGRWRRSSTASRSPGGTLPAMIWKEFQTRALALRGGERARSSWRLLHPGTWKRIVNRGGWQLDNGYCPGNTRLVVFFAGRGPTQTAGCKPNEVRVPPVVGYSLESAREQLALKPLDTSLIFAPAPAKVRPGVVIRQFPAPAASSRRATQCVSSSRPRITAWCRTWWARAWWMPAQLRKLRLKARISWTDGPSGPCCTSGRGPASPSSRAGRSSWPVDGGAGAAGA